MHQCSKNAKLGKIVESGGKATCYSKKKLPFVDSANRIHQVVPLNKAPSV